MGIEVCFERHEGRTQDLLQSPFIHGRIRSISAPDPPGNKVRDRFPYGDSAINVRVLSHD